MASISLRPETIRYASSEIGRIVNELNGSEVNSQMAHNLIKQLNDSEFEMVGVDRIVPACVYLADKVTESKFTLSEIEQVSRYDLNQIRSTSKNIRNELGLEIPIQTPANVLDNKISKLELESHEADCHKILSELNDTYKGSKNPVTVAAAVVYTVANVHNLDITQKDVSNVFDVSTVTIRNRYPEIRKNSSIKPPKHKRKFNNFDQALSMLEEELEIPSDILERAEAHVTLMKDDLEPSVHKAGIVLAAVAESATEEYGKPELKDNEYLASFADVSPQTIKKHREKFDQ